MSKSQKRQMRCRLSRLRTAKHQAGIEAGDNVEVHADNGLEDGDAGFDQDFDDDEEELEEVDVSGSIPKPRGLLTDIPLVLGPSEIESLPMIIWAGINVDHEKMDENKRMMQAVRCHVLLTRNPGRQLLRELLIFIAAWDLPEEELYFKLMVNIMDAVLQHGLLPYAYTSFGEPKDIVSPSQSTMLKILLQICRRKQERLMASGATQQSGPTVDSSQSSTRIYCSSNTYSQFSAGMFFHPFSQSSGCKAKSVPAPIRRKNSR